MAGTLYTTEQKEEAVNTWQELGTAEASRQTGIPGRTLRRWANDKGLVSQANAQKTGEARAAGALKAATAWGDFREAEALSAGAAAARLRNRLLEGRIIPGREDKNGNPVFVPIEAKEVKDLAVAYGILVDKAELLSGKATSRIEVWAESELDRDLKQAMAEMEEMVRDSAD